MTNKIKEMTRRIELEKDIVSKLSELRKLKQEIIRLETDFIKKHQKMPKISSKIVNNVFLIASKVFQYNFQKHNFLFLHPKNQTL